MPNLLTGKEKKLKRFTILLLLGLPAPAHAHAASVGVTRGPDGITFSMDTNPANQLGTYSYWTFNSGPRISNVPGLGNPAELDFLEDSLNLPAVGEGAEVPVYWQRATFTDFQQVGAFNENDLEGDSFRKSWRATRSSEPTWSATGILLLLAGVLLLALGVVFTLIRRRVR